jgi:lipopolysaccharide export system protein LptA
MRRLLVSAALCFALAPAALLAQARTACELVPNPNTRLSADSLPGIGQVVFVGGGVLLKCPQRSITLKGDSAEQFPDHYQVIGHSQFDDPRLHVTADYLNYFPIDERVVGAGNVHARLPSGSTLDGPQAEYKRVAPRIRTRAEINAIARPTITIVEKDSTGKPAPPATVVANTVRMWEDSLIIGWGQVVITRPEVTANADSAVIDQLKETMRLMRNPVLRGKKEKPFTLTGDLIDLYSTNRKLGRVLSRGNATAVSDSMTLKSDTLDLRVRNDVLDHAYAWGTKTKPLVISPSQRMTADSLDVTMPNQRIQLVRAFRGASAAGKPDTTRFVVQKPDTTDWIRGDTITAHFDSLRAGDTTRNPAIRQLVARGHASSLYHMAPNDSAERRPAINHVTARIITIDFGAQNKVATVTTVDSVSGVYIEPRPDSTARRGRGAQPAPARPGQTPPRSTVPSIIPVPTKPPTKPPR